MNLNIIKDADTPSYIFDLDILLERVLFVKKHIGRANLCYAMKANPFIVEALNECIDRFEICSPGEFCICEKDELPPQKLIISGVYKEESDINRMLKSYDNIGAYTVESLEQFELLNKYAKLYDRKINVFLRLTSGNQFGMDKEEIENIIGTRADYEHISIQGIQLYSSTQKSSIKKIKKELLDIDEYLLSISNKYDFVIKEFEYGPGFPVFYFKSEKQFDEEKYFDEFAKVLSEMKYNGKITLEVGRSIAACCGIYLTKVVDLKVNKKENYCIVDGGIHHISYYGQMMAMKVPYFEHFPGKTEVETLSWNICGSLCTVNDILIKQLMLCDLKKGDKLIFKNTGAYCMTEGISLFLSRSLPKVFLYSQRLGMVCVRDKIDTYGLNSISK